MRRRPLARSRSAFVFSALARLLSLSWISVNARCYLARSLSLLWFWLISLIRLSCACFFRLRLRSVTSHRNRFEQCTRRGETGRRRLCMLTWAPHTHTHSHTHTHTHTQTPRHTGSEYDNLWMRSTRMELAMKFDWRLAARGWSVNPSPAL